ncbi:MAG: hypothetical protein ACYC6Q_09115 [Syntrophales bacterium]
MNQLTKCVKCMALEECNENICNTVEKNNESQALLKSLLAASTELVKPAGRYTNPRTWGVYRMEHLRNGKSGMGFHFGNHPVRQQELIRKYRKDDAPLVKLFKVRNYAKEFTYLLNGGRRNAQ